MVEYQLPNTHVGKGRVRKTVIQSISAVSQGTANSPQTEVDIPMHGDVIALGIEITQTTTGTLTGANTIDYALAQLAIRDRKGKPILNSIRGRDLKIFDKYLNVGRNRTVASATQDTAKSHSFILPINIEAKDMPAKLQLTLAPYGDMATSGATGGTVTLKVFALYMDESQQRVTQRLMRITEALISGLNRLAPKLPKGVLIHHVLFYAATEGDITDVTLTADGSLELEELTVSDLTAIDDVRLVDGHLSGNFSLYNTPFVSNTRTVFDITASAAETAEIYLVFSDLPNA